MAVKSLKISVESLLEQEVDEINRDGEEKYIKPFDLSEELTYLAGKIDFYEGIQGHVDDDVDDKKADEDSRENGEKKDDQNDAKNENEWPWSSVHSKLRLALSEMCVMLDVLQTLNKKKFLVLDPIQQSPEQEKQTVQMLEKRKYLAKVGSVIGKGAAGLVVKSKPETIIIDGGVQQKSNESEYYSQLMDLRQFWRVKKSGNQIIGDLSYRSSGSRFWHPGLFEVKAHHIEAGDLDVDDKKSLSISISPDLTVTSHIIVQVADQNEKSPWSTISTAIQLEDNFVNAWEKDMSKAQQHLFNKEIFSQLSNDAFQGSFLGIEVLNSQIKCKVLGNAEVIISHNIDTDTTTTKGSDEDIETANDLTLLLSALLYQQHRNVSKFSTPYPATSNFYGKQTKSSSIISLTNRKPNEPAVSILKEFIKQAEHKIWVHRVNSFLYKQNQMYQDPVVSFHWNVLNSRLTSAVQITLSTTYIFKKIESSFLLTMNEEGFFIHGKDNVSVKLPFDMNGLKLILQNQVHKQLQSVVEVVCQQHGWSLVSLKQQSNMLFPTQLVRSPLVLRSFEENKTIYLYVHDMSNIKVEVSANAIDNNEEMLLDQNFQDLHKRKIKLSWNVLPGHSFVDKLQSLLQFS